MDKKTIVFVILIFACSFFYRFYLARNGPNYIKHDSAVYQQMAVDLFQGRWAIDGGNRTYYYPVFVMFVFRLFGFNNINGLWFAQSVVDSCSGIILFFIVFALTRKKTPAYVSAILYAANPLTSTYTGLYLTEVLSTLSVALILLVATSKKIRWILWGIVIGFAGTIRLAFLPLTFLFTISGPMLFYWEKIRLHVLSIVLSVVGVLVIFIYPILSMYMTMHRISLYPNNDLSKFYLYEGLHAHSMVEILDLQNPIEVQPGLIWSWDFITLPPKEYHLKADEIVKQYFQEVKANPGEFIYFRFIHIAKIWNKSHLYYYLDPTQPYSGMFLPFANGFLIFMAFVGSFWFVLNKWKLHRFFIFISHGIILFSTFLLALKPPEERLTIPMYPIVFLYAGIGISSLMDWVKQRVVNKEIMVSQTSL